MLFGFYATPEVFLQLIEEKLPIKRFESLEMICALKGYA